MGLNLRKLEKLKINAYTDKERKKAAPAPEFVAMFNPTELAQKYEIIWAKQAPINNVEQPTFSRSAPTELTLDLLLDGTGVQEMGTPALAQGSVKERIETFLNVAYHYNGTIHEPHYLQVAWGSPVFPCRLSSVDIKYTLFSHDGTPLRATLHVTLISDETAEKLGKIEQKSSPDLTHARVVRSGDTLPLLTKEIYGSSSRYLDVARFNGLDDFRNLTPGQELLFPPLTTFSEVATAAGGG